ncbi:MAG: hypothetical protein Q7K39_02595 [Candidatus Magasanikbacteria bacterium]|nr:hypothetical protein [Candidatus Magasanikbacteria bacterium]
MHFSVKAIVIASVALPLLGIGCVNSAPKNSESVSGANSARTFTKGELPENDCLGLTAGKAQSFCGSGPLVQKISPIYGGYQCVYSALDQNGAEGSVLGTELKLTYSAEGETMATIKKETKQNNHGSTFYDIANGFYMLTPVELAMGRPSQLLDYFFQANGLTITLSGTDVDYEFLEADPKLACSESEVANILAFVSGQNSGVKDSSASTPTAKPPTPKTESEINPTAADCCEIIVASVVGAIETKSGQSIGVDDRLQVGDKLYTVDGELVIGVICDDDPNNVKIFVVSASEPTEISIIKGADGKPAVKTDPGEAKTSIKQLPQFATDFQVSTPRLVCSVRG